MRVLCLEVSSIDIKLCITKVGQAALEVTVKLITLFRMTNQYQILGWEKSITIPALIKQAVIPQVWSIKRSVFNTHLN